MGPNEADIIRVSVRAAGSPVADNTLDPGVDAEVVVEVEAGSAVFFSGAHWQLGVTVKDLDGGVIPFTLAPTTVLSGNLNTPPPWGNQAETFTYTIKSPDLTLHKGHLCRVYGYLLIGTTPASYDATFVESTPFLILP
jgi:hypothetical protein